MDVTVVRVDGVVSGQTSSSMLIVIAIALLRPSLVRGRKRVTRWGLFSMRGGTHPFFFSHRIRWENMHKHPLPGSTLAGAKIHRVECSSYRLCLPLLGRTSRVLSCWHHEGIVWVCGGNWWQKVAKNVQVMRNAY